MPAATAGKLVSLLRQYAKASSHFFTCARLLQLPHLFSIDAPPLTQDGLEPVHRRSGPASLPRHHQPGDGRLRLHDSAPHPLPDLAAPVAARALTRRSAVCVDLASRRTDRVLAARARARHRPVVRRRRQAGTRTRPLRLLPGRTAFTHRVPLSNNAIRHPSPPSNRPLVLRPFLQRLSRGRRAHRCSSSQTTSRRPSLGSRRSRSRAGLRH